MIAHNYLCNLCHRHILSSVDGRGDFYSLDSCGPIGAEGSVMARNTYPASAAIHICDMCHLGLKNYFVAPEGKANFRNISGREIKPLEVVTLGKDFQLLP